MRRLITGICGLVGSSLAAAWLDSDPGITIVGVDNYIRQGSEQNREAMVRVIERNLLETGNILEYRKQRGAV